MGVRLGPFRACRPFKIDHFVGQRTNPNPLDLDWGTGVKYRQHPIRIIEARGVACARRLARLSDIAVWPLALILLASRFAAGAFRGLCYSAARGTIPTDRRCGLVLCLKTPIYRTSPATISFPKKAPVAERQLALPPDDGVRMSKANEFQIYAGECLSWAKSADTGEKRHQFLKLAQTWLRSAITAERQQISLDDPNK
jgi:hypothetical protein